MDREQADETVVPLGRIRSSLIRAREECEVDGECQVQPEADVGGVEIQAGDLLHALEAVEHGVAVDIEQTCGFLWSAIRVEERLERIDQITAVAAIVVD